MESRPCFCFAPLGVLALLLLTRCAGETPRRLSDLEVPQQEHTAPRSVSAVYWGRGSGGSMQPALASAPLPPPTSEDEPSFCKLNPGACREPLPEAEPGEDVSGDPWKSFACIQACNAGAAAMEKFCGNLPGRTKRQQEIKAICWGAAAGGKTACVVFCRAYFGPPRSSNP